MITPKGGDICVRVMPVLVVLVLAAYPVLRATIGGCVVCAYSPGHHNVCSVVSCRVVYVLEGGVACAGGVSAIVYVISSDTGAFPVTGYVGRWCLKSQHRGNFSLTNHRQRAKVNCSFFFFSPRARSRVVWYGVVWCA